MPFTSPLARDGFDGADTANIDDRTPDGDGTPALAVGLWARHAAGSSVTGTIGIAGNVAVKQGPNDAIGRYVITDIPSLPSTYRTELRGIFPATDVGGTPGTDPYVEPWRYRVTGTGIGSPIEGLVSDLGTSETFNGLLAFTNITYWPNGQPKSFDVAYPGTAGSGHHTEVEFYTVVRKTATGSHTYPVTLDWVTNANPTETSNPTPPPTTLFSNMGLRYLVAGVAPVPPVVPYTTWTGDPPVFAGSGSESRSVTSSVAAPELSLNFEFAVEGGEYSLDLSEIKLDGTTTFDVGTPASGGDEWAYFEACVRHDPILDTGYLLGVEFSHLGAQPKIFYWLYEFDDGTYTLLRESAGLLNYAHDVATLGSLEIDGNNVLHAYDATGDLLWDFAIGTDLADGTGEVVALHDTGLPGVSAWDDSDGAWMQLEQCTVYIDGPCEGPPDNGFPWEPPTPEPIPTYLYVMHHGQWRPSLVPTPEIPSITAQRFGGHRTATAAAVMYKGAWRFAVPDIDTIPEPDTPFPPFHDPCYLVPPIDPGPVLPLTGRFFGPSNTPLGALGPLFNGTQKALGGWYNNDLPYVAARDCTLVGAQGGSAVYKLPGGYWDLTTFVNATRAKLAPLYSLLLTYTASGHFFGYSMADDLESSVHWKPSGMPIGEFTTAVAIIRSEFPGIRLGARVRPSTSGGNPGLDFYGAQYVAKQGAPFGWGATEYSIARSRGAYVILSINLLHGGDGSSGIRYFDGTIKGQSNNNWECSPAEVYEYYSQMYAGAMSVDGTAGWLAGSLGYQYHPAFLARPGMLDAFVAARNELAALPAP